MHQTNRQILGSRIFLYIIKFGKLYLLTNGGAHAKHAVSPGISNCICPETASSDTPDQEFVANELHMAQNFKIITRKQINDQLNRLFHVSSYEGH